MKRQVTLDAELGPSGYSLIRLIRWSVDTFVFCVFVFVFLAPPPFTCVASLFEVVLSAVTPQRATRRVLKIDLVAEI